MDGIAVDAGPVECGECAGDVQPVIDAGGDGPRCPAGGAPMRY